jgi:fatty-acyl-CoA synthase
MPAKPIHRTPSAYSYQLLIKNILTTPLIYSPNQEIVYRDRLRYDYETFFKRVTRLAGMLQQQGVQPGDTVAIMDWDSHRYLECFFAVPMMGAVLHTINIRLSTEQLIYTINHAEDDVILVNAEFLRVLEGVKDQFETVKKIILLTDADDTPETSLAIEGEYEALLGKNNDGYEFPRFRRKHQGHHLLHDRHHRHAQRGLLQPPPAGAAHLRHHGGTVRIQDTGSRRFR